MADLETFLRSYDANPDATLGQMVSGLGPQATVMERQKEFLESLGVVQQQPASFGGFLKSALSSGTLEMIGMEPSPDVARFRQDNPGLGLVSQIGGELPLYALPFARGGMFGLRAARHIPGVRALLGIAESPTTGRLATGALTEIARFAPLQTARLAASTIPGLVSDDPAVSNTLKDVAFDTAFMGAVGSGLEFLRGMKGAKFGDVYSLTRLGLKTEDAELLVNPPPFFVKRMARQVDPDLRELKLAENIVSKKFPQYDVNLPPQAKIGFFTDVITRATQGQVPFSAEEATQVSKVVNLLKNQITKEQFEEYNLFSSLLGGGQATRFANMLVRDKLVGLNAKRMVLDPLVDDAFEDASEFLVASQNTEKLLGKDWQQFTQGLRFFQPKDQKANATLLRGLDTFQRVRSDARGSVWVQQETDNGMYAVVMEIPGIRSEAGRFGRSQFAEPRTPGAPKPKSGLPQYSKDSYLVFRTNDPARLVPGVDSLHRASIENFLQKPIWADYKPGAPGSLDPGSRVPMLNEAMKLAQLSSSAIKGLTLGLGPAKTKFGKWLGDMTTDLPGDTTSSALKGLGQMVRQAGKAVRFEFAPRMSEFGGPGAPRAVAMSQMAKQLFDLSSARAARMVYGHPNLTPDQIKNVYKTFTINALKKIPREGGLQLDNLVEASDIRDFSIAMQEGLSPKDMIAKGMSSAAQESVKAVRKGIDDLTREYSATIKRLGLDIEAPTSESVASILGWRGAFRVPLFNKTTRKVVDFAAGDTPDAALQEARRLAAHLEHTSPGTILPVDEAGRLGLGAPFSSSRQYDIKVLLEQLDPEAAGLRAQLRQVRLSPLTQARPTGLLKKSGGPPTIGQVEREMMETFVNLNDSLTETILRNVQKEEFTQLAAENPTLAAQYADRIATHTRKNYTSKSGIEEKFNQVLAPFMGQDAASELVRKWNRFIFQSTFVGDMGFLAMNLASMAQTAAPELSRLMTAGSDDLMKSYSHSLVMGRNQKAAGIMSVLDPWKYLWKTMKGAKNLNDEQADAMLWGLKNGAIAPQFTETAVGRDAEILRSLKQSMKQEGPVSGLLEWGMALGEFGPAKTEQLTRGLAFLTGYNFSREVLGVTPDAAKLLARQFTERTMYSYTTTDRPRLLTGFLGNAFGLFKNWAANYLTNFAIYSGDAFGRGNFAPLVTALLGGGAVGGAASLPLYGFADQMSKLLLDKSAMDLTYDMFGFGEGEDKHTLVADTLQFGLPALLGHSMSSRAALPGAHPLHDAVFFGNIASLDRAKDMVGFLGDAVDIWRTTGVNPDQSDAFTRSFIQAFAPRTVQRYWTVKDGALTSLRTGNKLKDDVSRLEALSTTFGIPPLEIEKQFAAANQLYESKQNYQEALRLHGEALYEAWAEQDMETFHQLLGMGLVRGLPIESLGASFKSNFYNKNKENLDRQFERHQLEDISKRLGLKD